MRKTAMEEIIKSLRISSDNQRVDENLVRTDSFGVTAERGKNEEDIAA